MPQAYPSSSLDTRTFGDLIQRVLDDLNRPDLQNIVPNYIRDAIRFYSRQPFFFNHLDNTDVQVWQASLNVPRGYTIRDTATDGNYYIFVALTTGLNSAGKPSFTPDIFVPSGQAGVVFVPGQTGTTVDTGVTWATVQPWPASNADVSTYWTQLSTVPSVNQYDAPIDYVSPYRVELTAAGLRFPLGKLSYDQLRNLDVIRPAPIIAYPTDYAWFRRKIYLWPYSVAFFPITLSYYTAPTLPEAVDDSNFWTTDAESLVRAQTCARINLKWLHDEEAARRYFADAELEFKTIRNQESAQQLGPIPSELW